MGVSERDIILLVAAGILGLLVGSFLNVCIFRLPRNCMSLVKPRSRCPRCLRPIAWYDNMPVLSWLILGGKCRGCRAPISPRYLVVELLTGALFFYAAWRILVGDPLSGKAIGKDGFEEATFFAVHAWFLGALIVCTFIDLEFRILPDEVTVSGIVIGIAAAVAFHWVHLDRTLVISNQFLAGLANSILGAATGAGSIWLVGVLGKAVFRKEAMGFGDVKFMGMVGAVLGLRGVLLTFVLACLFGSIFGIGKFAVVRRFGYVPFGPFLALGALLMLLASPLVDGAIDSYLDLFRPPPASHYP